MITGGKEETAEGGLQQGVPEVTLEDLRDIKTLKLLIPEGWELDTPLWTLQTLTIAAWFSKLQTQWDFPSHFKARISFQKNQCPLSISLAC